MEPSPQSNPYESPETPLAGEAPVTDKAATTNVQWPQPHLLWVLLIVIVFIGFQIVVGAVIGAFCVAQHMMQNDVPPENMAQAIEAALASASSQSLMIFAASTSTCLFAIALVFGVYGRYTGQRVAWRTPSLWQLVLVTLSCLPLALVVSEISNWLMPVVPSFGEDVMQQAMIQMAEMPLPLMVIAICILPAFGEELLFRGFIGRGLVGRHGDVVGVLITSVLFGLVHIHPLQAISAAILGVALHYIYLMTKSLLAPMLLHFLNNLFAMMCVRYGESFPIPGVSVMDEAVVFTHTPVGITVAAVATSALLLTLLYQSRSVWCDAEGNPWPFGYLTAETPVTSPIESTATSAAHLQSRTPNWAVILMAVVAYGGLLWLLGATIQQWSA